MPLDPRIRALLKAAEAQGVVPAHRLSVAEARAQSEARIGALEQPVPVLASVRDELIEGPAGELRLRVYAPLGTGPLPGIVFFHGGGFVQGSLETHDALCRNLCGATRAVLVAVAYRLAPEHPFPAAPDDCLAATQWVAAQARRLHLEPGRLALAGDSAGGNLAAVTALRCRESGPRLRAQVLIYPVTDHYRASYPSYLEMAEGYGLGRQDMIWFWDHYLQDAADAEHPHAAPLRAGDLRDLPPAFILSAEYDPLRDEAEHYARRLEQAGVPVTLRRYTGMNHGFFGNYAALPQAAQALSEVATWLERRL